VQAFRIGVFTEVYRPVRNGVVTSVEMLERELRNRGYDVVCVTPAVPGYDESEPGTLRIPSLPLPTRTAYRLTLPILTRAHTAVLRDVDIVHAHSCFVTGWMAVRLARRLRVPLVFTYHTQLEQYAHYVPFERRATTYAVTQLTRSYANAADAVIVPTAAMHDHLRNIGVCTRIDVVPSGIDVARFFEGRARADLRAQLGVMDGEALVLCVGRLGREKNLELALQAFARLERPAKLAVIGGGVERASLERSAQRLAPGRVRFMGEQPRESLPDIYASGDALLFTSASETQGLVLVESLASGLAVVAVDTPQGRDVLGGAARLCAPDPDALACGLAEALADGAAARLAGRARAKRFDVTLCTERIAGVYGSLRPDLLTPNRCS
jgi:1,2-diacylglycerol 3-alpha-glucosyltransferase